MRPCLTIHSCLPLSEEGPDLLRRAERRMARQLELLCDRTPDSGQVIASLAWLEEAIEAAATDRLERATNMPRQS